MNKNHSIHFLQSSLLFRFILAVLFFFFSPSTSFAQDTTLTKNQKFRYLKKIERKNTRFVKKQEKRTSKLLNGLSKQEKLLLTDTDSVKKFPNLTENTFDKIQEKLNAPQQRASSTIDVTEIKTSNAQKLIPKITEGDLDASIKDYLKKQITVSEFLSDSSCTMAKKLKKQSEKTKQSISKAEAKLTQLKKAETEIKQRQELLKNYGINTPQWKNKLKSMDKSLLYYKQGTDGFKEIYTNTTNGIENKVFKNISFSKNFSGLQNKLDALNKYDYF